MTRIGSEVRRIALGLARRKNLARFWARWVEWSVTLGVLGFGLAMFGFVALWLGAPRAESIRQGAFVFALLSPFLGAFLAGASMARRPWGPEDVALEVDDRLSLADRFSSALGLLPRSGEPMVTRLQSEVLHRIEGVDPLLLYPLARGRLAALGAVMVVLAILVALAPVPRSDTPIESAPPDPLAMDPSRGVGREGGPGARPGGAGVTSSDAGGSNPEGGALPDPRSSPASGSEPQEQPDPSAGADEPSTDNPGETPGEELFAEEDRAYAQRERIDLASMFSRGVPIEKEALVRSTVPGEGGVPGPGLSQDWPSVEREFEALAEEEVRSPTRSEVERDLVRRYFERLRSQVVPAPEVGNE